MALFNVKKTTTVVITYRVEADSSSQADGFIRDGDFANAVVTSGPSTTETLNVNPAKTNSPLR